MEAVKLINYIIAIVFLVCYTYQFFYLAAPHIIKAEPHKAEKQHRYAVLISARNEELVLPALIESIKKQTYGGEVSIFVCADNCEDATAAVAESAGATVFPRFNRLRVGKGYALEYLYERICAIYDGQPPFDGYFVFDADNILDENYIAEMNKTFSDGYEIITSYRNSKNYGDNWISAGYALWFLRESRYLNDARMKLGTSCAVSGTGFLFSRAVTEETGGWKFFLLTEDIEFSVHHITAGRRIGFCGSAVIYDEQPTRFSQSWKQRLRWARGYLQVFGKYGGDLLKGILHGSFACFDMTMNIMPAAILSFVGISVNLAALIASAVSGLDSAAVLSSALTLLVNACLTVFILGAATTITEWKRIYAPAWKKVLYAFTFPFFMLTYIPISLAALFTRKVGWSPIVHQRAVALEDIRRAA